jgi:hypothetical protein
VIIKCTKNEVELEFSEKECLRLPSGSEYFRVTIRSHNLSGFTKVYIFDPFDYGLTNFFKELAENWKGFEGEKIWESLEGEFKLVCTSDSLGHFEIKATIRNNLGTLSVKTIHVESGQLNKIAAEAKAFFDVST